MSWECFPVWEMVTAVVEAPATGAEQTATVEAQAKEQSSDKITSVESAETASADDLEAITKALEEAHAEQAAEKADKKHAGLGVDDCRACRREYRLNGQLPSEAAQAAMDSEESKDEVEGGPLDQLECIVM